MSDERNSIRYRTGGNDNVLSILGDLLSSDGVRAFRVPLGTPGGFLAVDLTAECGLSWQVPSGNLLTFSDGLTKLLNNVTNDLVTGTVVGQVNAKASGNLVLRGTTVGTSQIHLVTSAFATPNVPGSIIIGAETNAILDALESVIISAGDNGINGNVEIYNNVSNLSSIIMDALGDITVTTTGTSDIAVISGQDEIHTVGRDFSVSAVSDISLTTAGTGDLTATISHDEVHTIGRDFSVSTANDINLTTAGVGDLTAIINHDEVHTIGRDEIHTVGRDFTLSTADDINLTTAGTGDLIAIINQDETHTIGRNFAVSATGNISLTTAGTGDLTATISHDEVHTIGRNFTLTAAGSGGVGIEATNGNLTLDAGPGDGTAEVRIMPTVAAPAATRTFRIWNGVGDGQGTVLTPTTGVVIDAEVRAALDSLLQQLHDWGWLTNPNP